MTQIIKHSRGKGQAKYENGEWWFRYLADCKYKIWSEWQKDLAPISDEWMVMKKAVEIESHPRYKLGKTHAEQKRPPAELTDIYLQGYAEGRK